MAKHGELSDQQERFCREYLVDRNGTQAALRAAYSTTHAAVTGSKLLATPMVAEWVAAATEKRNARVTLTPARLLEELGRLALVDVGQAFNTDGTLKQIHEIPEDVRRC